MLSRMSSRLSSSLFSFWNNTHTPEQTKNTNNEQPFVESLRRGLETAPDARMDVANKIRLANTNLVKKMGVASTPSELVAALEEWELELDILSQALPTSLESFRDQFAQEIDKITHEEKGEHFHVTLSGHTHVTNRVRLIMKHGDAIRNLRGHDSTTGLWAITIAIIQTLLASLMREASWSNYLLVMTLIGSILNHTAGMAIHEASHNLAAPTPTLNRLVGLAANLPLGIPHHATFERYHMKHHLFLGQPDQDNDLPAPILAQWVGNSSAKKAIFAACYPLAYATTQQSERLSKNQIGNLVTQVIFDASILYFFGPWALMYLLGSTLVGFSALNPVSAHWIDEHYERDEDGQETHSYYGWLNLLNFNVGYHNEHHDFTDIPGSKLPALHKIAQDHYGKQHPSNSWLNTIWRFITDPNISAHSRIIRTAKAQHYTNALAITRDKQEANLNHGR